MKAAIYSRKSKFSEKGESIENQIQMCKEYASINLREKNITEFLIYEDEGFSGGNTNRPEFKRLINDAKSKKYDILICYRLDRISRNVADFSNTLELLQGNNIDFVSIKEQFDTTTPMGRAMIYISSVFAQLERETIAERVRDNMLELAKTGRWLGGTPPLGFTSKPYKYLDENLKERSMAILEPNENELNTVKIIFQKYLELKSLSSVQRYLLQNYIKTRNNADFTLKSISNILTNPVYTKSSEEVMNYLRSKGIDACGSPDNTHGIILYNKFKSNYTVDGELVRTQRDKCDWVAGVSKHNGIIESKEWIDAQKLMTKNSIKFETSARSTKALLTGILKCAKCNSRMRILYASRNKTTGFQRTYYACNLKKESGSVRCDNKNVRVDELDSIVIEALKNLGKNKQKFIDNLLEKNKAKSKNKELANYKLELEKQITTKENQINNLVDKLSFDNDISDILVQKIKVLKQELYELKINLSNHEEEVEQNKQEDLDISFIGMLLNQCSIIDSLNHDEKKLLIKSLIKDITWNGDDGTFKINFIGSDDDTPPSGNKNSTPPKKKKFEGKYAQLSHLTIKTTRSGQSYAKCA